MNVAINLNLAFNFNKKEKKNQREGSNIFQKARVRKIYKFWIIFFAAKIKSLNVNLFVIIQKVLKEL